MVSPPSRIKTRLAVTLPLLGFAAVVALIGAAAYAADSKLANSHATATAIITQVDNSGDGDYSYTYKVGTQTCSGTTNHRQPFPRVGDEINIYYDPNDVCDNLDYNPVQRRQNDQILLAGFASSLVVLSVVVLVLSELGIVRPTLIKIR